MKPNARAILDDDFRFHVEADDGKADAALWCRRGPVLPGERLGVIGNFSATSAVAAAEVLACALKQLRFMGGTMAIGPMNGSTWRDYRFVTDPGTTPAFFMEPANPPEWPAWWRAAGFTPLAEYFSTATDDLGKRDPRVAEVAARMIAGGLTIRALDVARFEEELNRIYDVSAVSFQPNFLYSPIAREEFLGQYRALKERVRPELVLIAEEKGQPVGYVFALPDFATADKKGRTTTAIVKTLAVLPGRRWAGLGALLLAEVHEAMRRLKFKRAIHALMHETNASRNLSAHYTTTIRRYTLFGLRLTGNSAM
ncbi:MAG: GNAT family N-acetyltransferase [Opitutaceae bacterium]